MSAGAAVTWPAHVMVTMGLLAGVVLLSLDRSFDTITFGPTVWSATSMSELRVSLWARIRGALAPHRWLDGTTWVGATVLLATYALLTELALRDGRQQTALIVLGLLITPLWTTGTTWHLPWDGVRGARELQRWMQRHRTLLGDALGQPTLLVARDDNGRVRDVRVALPVDAYAAGLNSLDLVWVTDARSMRKRVALFAQAQSGSAADQRLKQLPMTARRTVGASVIHAVPSEHVAAAIDGLRGGQRSSSDATNATSVASSSTNALGRAAA